MPLARVSMLRGKPVAHRKAILDGIYQALRETFAVPDGDRFMTIDEYDPANFNYSGDYLDVSRSDDLVVIQLTVNNTRGTDQKRALYSRIAELLGENPGLRSEDVMIVLVEVLPENWSFGNGVAHYAK